MKEKKDPPHLPARACRVDTHYRLRSLRWTLFLIFVAFISGTAAALSSVAWLAPVLVQPDSFYSASRGSHPITTNKLDSLFQHQVGQKILKIYDQNKKISKSFYDKDSLLFNSAILSSDGWAVAYYPQYIVGSEKYWEVIDSQGSYYDVENTVYDSISELLYIKVAGQGFRLNSFSDWSDLSIGNNYWALGQEGWEEILLEDLISTNKTKAQLIWRPQYFYSVWQDLDSGSLLFDGRGSLVGVVDEEKMLRPAWLVGGRINSLLDLGRISYSGLPWRGYIVEGVELEGKWKKLTGFYISDIDSVATTSTIGLGDVVFKINGESIKEKLLAAQLFSASDILTVSVWRDGKELDIEVQKVKVF